MKRYLPVSHVNVNTLSPSCIIAKMKKLYWTICEAPHYMITYIKFQDID